MWQEKREMLSGIWELESLGSGWTAHHLCFFDIKIGGQWEMEANVFTPWSKQGCIRQVKKQRIKKVFLSPLKLRRGKLTYFIKKTDNSYPVTIPDYGSQEVFLTSVFYHWNHSRRCLFATPPHSFQGVASRTSTDTDIVLSYCKIWKKTPDK